MHPDELCKLVIFLNKSITNNLVPKMGISYWGNL